MSEEKAKQYLQHGIDQARNLGATHEESIRKMELALEELEKWATEVETLSKKNRTQQAEIERLKAIKRMAYEACCTGDTPAEQECIRLCDEYEQALQEEQA